MDYNVTIQCFHGTNRHAARNILETKSYTFKQRENHWLGHGVYFFREDPDQALSWAFSNTKPGDNAVVLSTIIGVNSSSFLNLDTRTGLLLFQRFLDYLKIRLPKISNDDPEGINKLRCFILDLLPESIQAIQRSFKLNQKSKALNHPLLELMDLEQLSIQVCVRDQGIIDKDSIDVIMEKEKRAYSFKLEKGPKITIKSRP